MVDYNIAIPQQQLFQAPDLTQNAMRMQQMQMQEMQMQELARKSASDIDTRQLYADPNFDPFSQEGARQLSLKGGPEVGFAAVAAARQNENLQRQTALTNAGLEKTRLEIGDKEYDIAQNRLSVIRPGDAKGYAEWDRVHGPAFRANGVISPRRNNGRKTQQVNFKAIWLLRPSLSGSARRSVKTRVNLPCR
jgi:hypothetical protein